MEPPENPARFTSSLRLDPRLEGLLHPLPSGAITGSGAQALDNSALLLARDALLTGRSRRSSGAARRRSDQSRSDQLAYLGAGVLKV